MAAGFFVLPAFAQHMNAPDAPCPSSRMGGAEGTRCFYDAAKKADGELAETYRRTLSVLDAAGRGQLQRAQETWLRYREQTCRAEYDLYGGGTGGLTALPACLEAETRQRIEDLEAIYGWKVEKFGG